MSFQIRAYHRPQAIKPTDLKTDLRIIASVFTDIQIQQLKPKKSAYRVFEKGSDPGFHVKVYPSGKKTFFKMYRYEGQDRFYNCGPYRKDSKSLTKARASCRAAQYLLDDNIDPREHKEETERAEREARKLAKSMGTVNALFEQYIDRLEGQGKRSADEVKRIWLADVATVIGRLKANEVTPADISEVLRPIINGTPTPKKVAHPIPKKYTQKPGARKSKPRKRPAPTLANRCRAYLMAAFEFGMKWDHDPKRPVNETLFSIDSNPVAKVPNHRDAEKPGERALTADEVRACWPMGNDQVKVDLVWGLAFRLLIITGQRVEQVLHAKWTEFDLKKPEWAIPTSRTKKQDRPHIVPLTPLAVEVLAELHPITGNSDYLFPQTRDKEKPRTTSGFKGALARYAKLVDVERFNARDIRRTVKTLMGERGISKECRDRVQNHALTDVSSKSYDRYEYWREKTEALNDWDTGIRRLLACEPIREPNAVDLNGKNPQVFNSA